MGYAGYYQEQADAAAFIRDWFGQEINPSDILYADSKGGYSWGEVLILYETPQAYMIQDDCDAWEPRSCTLAEAIEHMEEFEATE